MNVFSVNTRTAYLNTEIVFKTKLQSVRIKDCLTGLEYIVYGELKLRLCAGKHNFLCVENGEQFSIFVHDAIKLGGGSIKNTASYISEECPWIILTTSDRMYGHNRLTGYEFIEHKLTAESIKWLRSDLFLLQSSFGYIVIDILTKRILLSAKNMLFCNAEFAIYKTITYDVDKSIISYNVYDITEEKVIVSTEGPISITSIEESGSVLFYVKCMKVHCLNLDTKHEEETNVSLNVTSPALIFNFFDKYIIVENEIINLINGTSYKIPLIEGCKTTKILNIGNDGNVNEVSITRIDTDNNLIVWYEVLLCENKKNTKKYIRADIYKGSYEFVRIIPYKKVTEHRCIIEKICNNIDFSYGRCITCSHHGNLFLYEKNGMIYFYDKRNEESYLILEDLFDSTICKSAYFTSDGKSVLVKNSDSNINQYDIEEQTYNSFEIKGVTSFNFFKGVYNGYLPELRFNPTDCTKPIWKDPISLRTIDPYDIKKFEYVSADGRYAAEAKIEREYVNLLSGKPINNEEYNKLVHLYDFAWNRNREEIIKCRRQLYRNDFFKTKYTENDLSYLERFTRLFIEKRCWLNILDKFSNSIKRVFIGVDVTYLNYVSFSYDSRYVAIGGKIYEGSNQPGIFVLYDLVDDKCIVKGGEYELQAVWMTVFNKVGDCAFYDSRPTTYLLLASSNYTKYEKIEDRSLLCFSPSGKYVVLSRQGYTRYTDDNIDWGHQLSTMVYLRSIDQHKEIAVFNDLADNVGGLKRSNNVATAAFSSDEKRLLMISDDGVLVVRNLSGIVPTYKSTSDDVEAVPLGVREIKAKEFLGNTSLKKVVIPNSVTKIGEGAFAECTSLESIEIPDSVIEIERCAFSKCSKLRHVTLPKHLSKISESLFYQCSSLEGLVVPNSVVKIGEGAFYGCTSLESIEISDSVIEIERCAFAKCSKLRHVTLPKYLSKIEVGLFYQCSSLEGLLVPNGVQMIELAAFRKCTSLEGIAIPSSVTDIGRLTFAECSSLRKVVIPDSVAKIREYAFCGCISLESIEIPDSVTEIGEYAFSKCAKLRHVTLPKHLSKISESLFWQCSSLEGVVIPNSVKDIAGNAFGGCVSLDIDLSQNLHFIVNEGVLLNKDANKIVSFLSSNKIKEYSIPNSIVEIGSRAFSLSPLLEYVKIPENVNEINSTAFCNVNSIMSFSVSESNQYFSSIDGILYNKDVTILKRVPVAKTLHFYKIPEGITKIEAHAFCGCTAKCIEIPSSVREFERRALNFEKIHELHIEIVDIMKCTIDDEVFDNNDIFETCVLYVPKESLSLYKHHPVFSKFKHCDYDGLPF